MTWRRRGLGWLAGAALAVSAVCPALAAPGEEPFADFRIDAAAMDFPQQSISVLIYETGEDGQLHPKETVERECTLNRVTGDASFYIQPRADNVWVTVDCLTDLDGDGVYELVDGGGVRSLMAPQEGLVLQPAAEAAALDRRSSYVLEARTLVQFSEETAVQASAVQAGQEQDRETGEANLPLYMVKLHCGPAGEGERVQSYYLKIFGQVLIPDDVSPSDWYYSAVEFSLSRGYLTGTGDGTFAPDSLLDRAQLAQILWRMGGSLAAQEVRFTDVTPQDWYCAAVSWCCQEGVMSGASPDTFGAAAPLTREQLALILYQYAHRGQPLPDGWMAREEFSDWSSVSPWAWNGVDWAVTNGLLSPNENAALNPGGGVTRSDMAVVLYRLSQIMELR